MYSRARFDEPCDVRHAFEADHPDLRGFSILHIGQTRNHTTLREIDKRRCFSCFGKTLSRGE
jgi:hypothetical protein